MTEVFEIKSLSGHDLKVAEDLTNAVFDVLKKNDSYDVNGINLLTTAYMNILSVLAEDGIINANFIADTADHIKDGLLVESNPTIN